MTLPNENLTTPELATEYLRAKYAGHDDVMFIGGLLPCPVNHHIDEAKLIELKRGSKRNEGCYFFEKTKLCRDCQAMQPWTSWHQGYQGYQGKMTGGAPQKRRCAKCDCTHYVRAKRERKNGRASKTQRRKADLVNQLKECRGALCNGPMVGLSLASNLCWQ